VLRFFQLLIFQLLNRVRRVTCIDFLT
jgi:hypothetical protein